MNEKSNLNPDTRFVNQFFDLWINPEIERRKTSGNLPNDFKLFAVQVIMNFDSPTEVRLNEEVKAVVKGKSARLVAEGEKGSINEMLEDIQTIELTDRDPNAGHFSMLLHRGNWLVVFDFRYNAELILQHLEVAKEFLDSANLNLKNGNLRVVADNLFSSVELMAKGQLIMHDKTVFNGKKHGLIHARFNQWGNLGNADSRFTQLLNKLTDLRNASRYLRKDFSLTEEEAQTMIAIAQDMFTDLNSQIPHQHKLPKDVSAT